MTKQFFGKSRWIFVSPWLLAAAIGLMTLIIFAFAANNIQREKALLTDSLYRKGQAIFRFVEASMRATMMHGLIGLRGPNLPSPGPELTQRLIEQVSEAEDIHYIAIIDATGQILAHSAPGRIGQIIDRDLIALSDFGPDGAGVASKFHIVTGDVSPRKVFEVVSPFAPFRRVGPDFMDRWRELFLRQHAAGTARSGAPDIRYNPEHLPSWTDEDLRESSHMILVGLDMTELENASKQYRYQIVFLSLVLFLVGLGSWITLLVAQGYTSSQKTLNQIKVFTGLLISRLPVGIIATSPEGTIKTFNQAAADMIEVDHTAAVNRRPEEVLPVDLTVLFTRPGPTDEVAERELALTTGDGRTLSLHLSSLPMHNPEGGYIGRVLLMHDLSALKKLEKEVQRHDRLVALGKMAAGVAHEVRNPLSSIKGFAILLGRKFKPGSEEKEAADLLVHEAERLNRSITELLNYARPTPLKRELVNLDEILRNSVRLASADAEAVDAVIVLNPGEGLPRVSVDPDRLNQVLLNLYLNGLQAMEGVGTSRKLTVASGQSPDGRSVVISVTDTGRGIPAELLDRVLDPYFTTKPDGTGLGLAMAYKIIDEHGGTIRFDSRVGEGTRVTVTLPVA